MFGKITNRQVAHHFNKAKDFLGNAYNHTRNFLGGLDQGVRTFKQVYGAIAPVLESYGVNPGSKTVMKALSGYDTIRGHVMEGHDRVANDVNNIKNTFAKKNIKFDFSN
jgi:hypothetical protein